MRPYDQRVAAIDFDGLASRTALSMRRPRRVVPVVKPSGGSASFVGGLSPFDGAPSTHLHKPACTSSSVWSASTRSCPSAPAMGTDGEGVPSS